jgi:hypothetical protein
VDVGYEPTGGGSGEVNVMGGTVIETESEKLIRRGKMAGIAEGKAEGKAEMIIEMGQEIGLDDETIIENLQKKVGLPLETATAYLQKYGKSLV